MDKLQNLKHKSRIRPRKPRRVLGSRAYKNYSTEMLDLACEAVAKTNCTSRDAERLFGIPRRTILNKMKGKHIKTVGHPTALTMEQEENMVKVLQASSDYGCPLTKLDLKLLVSNYLKKNSQSNIFQSDVPGDAWVKGFLLRHANKLSLRISQNITKGRAEKSPQEMAEYFECLNKTLKNIPPDNILNFDETSLSDDPGASKAIFRRGVKYPERIMNASKGNISIMYTVTASGKCLPLYVVYKASNLYSEWISGGPPDTRYNCTKSGWFDSATFEDYFEKIIIPWAQATQGTKVVICDNLSSHLNINVVKLCHQNDIKLVFIPPRSTHLTQPLDVGFFSSLKKSWRQILYNYKLQNPDQTSLNKKHFPKLLVQLSDAIKINEESNIKSGFKATGIFPLNPQEVLKRMPEIQSQVLAYEIDEVLVDYLKETRSPKPLKVTRNKKVNCQPGKSVTMEDFNENVSKKNKRCKTKNLHNNESATLLDDQNGLFVEADLENLLNEDSIDDFMIQSLDDSMYFDDDMVKDPESMHDVSILRSPESLSKICLNVINSYMSQSDNITSSPVRVSNKASTCGSNIVTAGKIIIQSCEIIKEASKSYVRLLNDVTNTNENTAFIATHEKNLPEHLKIKRVYGNIEQLNVKNTLTKLKHIDINDKLEISVKEKKPVRKPATKTIKKKQQLPSSSTTSDYLSESFLLESQQEKGILKNVKQESSGSKNKVNNKNMKKNKSVVVKKKQCRASRKQRIIRRGSMSSSNSANSSIIDFVTADSDDSNYATLQDYYISECLRDQEEKENVDINDVPFGMHDIEYFIPETNKLQEGNWVVVRFSTKKSTKHFVGKILSLSHDDVPRVKFARKVKESKCKEGTLFTYPTIDDICTISHMQDIMTVLSEPKVTRRGQFIFNADLTNFNIQ